MGVPGFFGWVKRSYPRCVRAYVEGSVKQQNASSGSDSEHEVVEENQEDLDANPNHIEFDNFYLDMNGLIHACSHGDMYQNQPQNEEEIMIRIGVALNRLMNAVRPRNLVYLAIDGVAPRAKMNQQRSRRFISAKRQQLSKAHQMDASSSPNKYEFDSNAVTPGTQFMTNVGKYLRRFIHEELVNNPRWSNLKVFISDASVPGEGEHKIMDFIRKQRMQPGFDPNMTHILYGQDADLIFLGLGTHEVGFYILRDSMAVICKQCRRAGHNESTCFMYAPREDKPVAPGEPAEFVPLELVELPLLRQYLFRQFQIGREHMDLESIIDDFIMLCIFLGNDFLPSLPTLRISEDGLDLIIKLYRLLFINKHTPLYNKGKIRWDHLYWFLDEIAKYESKILRIRYSRKNKPNKEETKFVAPSDPNKIDIDPELSNENSVPDSELANEILVEIQSELVDGTEEEEDGTADLNGEIALLGSQIETDKISENLLHKILSGDLFEDIMVKRQIECSLLSEIGYPDDKWRENYHKLKFGSGSVEQVGLEYLVGVHWVMEYYLKGCPAWGWYYPHHYSAFAQDLVECLDVRQVALIELKWGQYLQADTGPFEPFQQLLAVLPLQSSKLLPQCYSDLMRSPNFESWYPIHFAIDIEQKREGIALLPFIDASVLQAGVAGQKESLTQEDVIRNASREAAVFFPCTIKEIFDDVIKLYTEAVPEIALDQDRHFLTGTVKRIEGIIFDTEAIVIATLYQNPSPPDQWIYKPNLLRGAKFSPKDITKEDLVKKKKELPRPGIGATLYMQPEYAIASFWPKIESTNVGYQMLAKLGWKGGPLGKNQEGISEPIQATRQEDQEMCSLMDVVDLELSDQRRVTSLKLNGKRSQRELNLYNKISSSFALKLTDNMGNYCALNNLPELVISCEGLTNQQRAFVHTLCRKKRSGKPTYSSYSSGPKHDRTLHVTCKVSTDVAAVLSRNLRELTPEQLALATELDGQKVVEYELGRLAENSQASAVDQNSASSRKKNESKSMDFSFAYSDEPVKQSRFNSSRSFHTQKSEVCRMFSRGHCIRGDRCKFLHVTEPARPGRRPNTHTDNDNNNNTEETRHHGATFAVAEGIETVPPRVSRMQMREDQRAKERNEERYKLSDKLQTDWRSKKEDRTPYDSAEPREYRERRQPYDSPEPREYRERRQPFRQESAQQRYEPMVDQESAVVKEERQSQRPERTEYRERRQPFRQESVQQRYEPQRNTVDPVIKDTPMEAQETPIIAKEAPMDKEERQPRSERREYRERKQPYDSAEPREYRERKQPYDSPEPREYRERRQPYDSPEPREYRERRQPFRQESAQQRYEPQRNTFQPKMVPEIKDTPMVVQETPIVPKETPVVTKETPVAIKETSVVKEERLPQRTEPNEAAPVQMDIVAQPPTTKPRESRERPRREQQMKGNDNVTVSVNLDPRGPRPKKEPFKKDSQPVHNSSRPDYRPDQPKQHLALKLVGINKSTRKSAIESELHKWEIPFSELFLIRSDVGILKFANEDDLRHAMEHAHTPLDQFGIQFEIDTNDRSTIPDRREKPKHGGKSDRKEYAPKKSSSGMTQEMQSLEITDTRASPSPGLNEVEPEVKQPPAMQLTSNEVQQPVQNTNNTSSLKKMKPSSASFKPYGHANHNDPQPQDSVGYVMNLQQSLSPQDAMYYTQQQYYQQQYLAQQYQQQQYYQQQYQDPQYTQQGSNQPMYRMYPPGSQM